MRTQNVIQRKRLHLYSIQISKYSKNTFVFNVDYF